jgi:hypothetical protein
MMMTVYERLIAFGSMACARVRDFQQIFSQMKNHEREKQMEVEKEGQIKT